MSQSTAGIVAAIFCAVVFIGVGALRCMLVQGAWGNNRNAQNAGNTREREVVGADESYAYQADFPPSYSTGKMNHSELFVDNTLYITSGHAESVVLLIN